MRDGATNNEAKEIKEMFINFQKILAVEMNNGKYSSQDMIEMNILEQKMKALIQSIKE